MERQPPLWGSFTHPVNLGQVLAGVLGLGLCVAVGALLGQPESGVVAAFGALALSTAGTGSDLKAGAADLAASLAAGALGFLISSFIPHEDIFLLALPPVFFVAAMIGGISRRLARATGVFNLFIVIGLNLGGWNLHPGLLPLLFVAGAAVTFVLALLFWPLRRVTDEPRRTAAQLWNHWKKDLQSWSGWNYAFRVGASSLAAGLNILFLPLGHPLWILLTVMIVVQRNIFHVPPRMFQRGMGTLIGVILLLGLSLLTLNTETTLVLIAVLTALRIHLKEQNYLAYSAVMTILVILMLDFGIALSYQTMLDRFLGTLIGGVLALVFGYVLWPKPPKKE